MKKTISILLAALMMLSLVVACGAKNPLVGTWELDFDALMAEMSEEEKAFMTMMGVTAEQYQMSYTFKADGTGVASMNMFGQSEEVSFTYTAADGKIDLTATVDGETSTQTLEYTIEGNTLILSSEGESMTFKRK